MRIPLLIILLTSGAAIAQDPVYVGGGRYDCAGSSCATIKAIQNSNTYESLSPRIYTAGVTETVNSFNSDWDTKRQMEIYRLQAQSDYRAAEKERLEREAQREADRAESDAYLRKLRAEDEAAEAERWAAFDEERRKMGIPPRNERKPVKVKAKKKVTPVANE